MTFQVNGTTIIQDTINVNLGSSARNSTNSTSIGIGAGGNGTQNTALGYDALHDIIGFSNIAIGNGPMAGGDTGPLDFDCQNNIMIGNQAGLEIYSSTYNIGLGQSAMALANNTSSNIAIGHVSLIRASSSSSNIAIGNSSMTDAVSSSDNIAIGNSTMVNAVGTDNNIAIGRSTMGAITQNFGNNIAIGNDAMIFATTTRNNIVMGQGAARFATLSIGRNIVIGNFAGRNLNGYLSIYIGDDTSGSGNKVSSGHNNIVIGHDAEPSSETISHEITLGNADIQTLRCGNPNITSISDERDKTDIEDIDWSTEFIKDMRPVKFTWNKRDGGLQGKKSVGFIAQELDTLEEKYGSHEHTRLVYKENPERLEATPLNTYPIVIKALQDIISRIEAIEAKLSSL